MKSNKRLRIGFIPLVDAAALIVAVDKGFARAEGINVDLVREVSWSNVRDKLNIGLFDAAHMLAPVTIASSLGIGHVRVPIIGPFNLSLNGNAITVSARLYAALQAATEGDLADPIVSARALSRLVRERRKRGDDPLTFGMTFPFSNHNYQLRFWMGVGGVDPDEDVRLVVLPPPYMTESLSNGHVDGFCVGAPWNSVAVELGIGRILHFGCELQARLAEKVLAVRESWAEKSNSILPLLRALDRGAAYVDDPANVDEVAVLLAQKSRIDVPSRLIRGTLQGRLKIGAGGGIRESANYVMIGGDTVARPDPVQAAWIYAQMARWGQAPLSAELLAAAKAVFRPDLYDAAIGLQGAPLDREPADGIGAFAGPPFDANDVAAHLAACGPGRVT